MTARINPHAQSGQMGEVELDGIRLSVPLGDKWTPQESAISKVLVKQATVIIAQVAGNNFGMYIKKGRYEDYTSAYTPIIECTKDLIYIRELIRKHKKVDPKPVLLKRPQSRP